MANQEVAKQLNSEAGTRPVEGEEAFDKADEKGRVKPYSTSDADVCEPSTSLNVRTNQQFQFPSPSLYQAGQEVFVVMAGARGALGPFVVEKWLGNGLYRLRDKRTGAVSEYPEGNVHRDLPS